LVLVEFVREKGLLCLDLLVRAELGRQLEFNVLVHGRAFVAQDGDKV